MSEKVIRVLRAWTIKYWDLEGNEHDVTLDTQKEYVITANGGEKVYPIITVARVQRAEDGTDEIVPKLQLDLGYMNPIHEAKCGPIPVPQICNIEEVITGYVSEHRNKKSMSVKGEPYTFAFDKRTGGEFRITVYAGEMLAFSVKNKRPDAGSRYRNIYGAFKGFDESTSELIIDRYLASNGVRQIAEDYRIKLDTLRAIFRYALVTKTEEDLKAEAEEREARKKRWEERHAKSMSSSTEPTVDTTVETTEDTEYEEEYE